MLTWISKFHSQHSSYCCSWLSIADSSSIILMIVYVFITVCLELSFFFSWVKNYFGTSLVQHWARWMIWIRCCHYEDLCISMLFSEQVAFQELFWKCGAAIYISQRDISLNVCMESYYWGYSCTCGCWKFWTWFSSIMQAELGIFFSLIVLRTLDTDSPLHQRTAVLK